MFKLTLLLSCVLGFCCSCSIIQPYRIDIQQGNVLEESQINQLQYGMSQQQVKYLLGTPIITATFDPNRWDYIYRIQAGYKKAEQKQLTLKFNKNQLVYAAGDFVVVDQRLASQSHLSSTVPASKNNPL